MSTDPENPVSSQPSGHDIHRRVSIVEGHDNPAFDSPRSRKVSAASEHAEMGPVRKKSILHHSHAADGGKTEKRRQSEPKNQLLQLEERVTSRVHHEQFDVNVDTIDGLSFGCSNSIGFSAIAESAFHFISFH